MHAGDHADLSACVSSEFKSFIGPLLLMLRAKPH